MSRSGDGMKEKQQVWGGIGVVVTAICCYTPILVIGVTALGVAGLAVYLDRVLFPLLGFFILVTGYGLYRMSRVQSVSHQQSGPSGPTFGAPPARPGSMDLERTIDNDRNE